ncbi:MAG: folylpolyglutamate synthase/dihydrofolate synthase family protein [Hyphomonadaceae bacterium]
MALPPSPNPILPADLAQQSFTARFGPEFGHGKAFDLTHLRAALAALGHPQTRLPPAIHVAGTNGKGSAIAFMRAIAEAAGLKVHAFTKPHLFALRERFVIAGAEASDEALIGAAERIARAGVALTQFDAQVAAAFLLFSDIPADLVLLETGMGGRDDSTNVIERPALSVITPIDLDHQDVLGSTLADIAAHKAGILKAGVPAIVSRQSEEASAVIEAQAEHVGAPLFRQGVEWDAFASKGRLVVQAESRVLDLPLPHLHGAHQIENAGLACAALMQWRELSDEAFAVGVAGAQWPGRLQPLTRGAFSAPIRAIGGEVWIDGGHNVHAGIALAHALNDMKARRGGANIAIVGLRKRKTARTFVAALARFADQIIAVPLSGEDHVSVHEVAKVGYDLGKDVSTAASLAEAMQNAAQSPAPRVLICGSFLLAAEALRLESA